MVWKISFWTVGILIRCQTKSDGLMIGNVGANWTGLLLRGVPAVRMKRHWLVTSVSVSFYICNYSILEGHVRN